MSTRVDLPTYEYSLLLIDVINEVIPEASARPARAKNWERVHSLFKTKQIQLVLLSMENAEALVTGSGPFSGTSPVEARSLYRFENLVLLAQPDFPTEHAWLLTDAIMQKRVTLPGAEDISLSLELENLHEGSRSALQGRPINH